MNNLNKFDFVHVSAASSNYRSLVEKIIKKVIVPIYQQEEYVYKVFKEDRICELMFDKEDKVKSKPLGILVYKKELSDEFGEYGIEKSFEVKSLFLINAEENSKKGSGSALLLRILGKCAELRAENLHLTVSSLVPSVSEFFKKKHFVEKHCWGKKYREDADEFLFCRRVHLHQITLQEKYLQMIINGQKNKEGRTNIDLFKKIETGEIIRFFNPNTKSDVFVEVVDKNHFPSFKQMLVEGGINNYLPNINGLKEAIEIYHSIPNYREREKNLGVLGLVCAI